MTPEQFQRIAERHGLTFTHPEFPSRVRGECGCGWTSGLFAKRSDAEAEHAAHVHVVMGLTVEGGAP